jgi:hypothetical protein
VIGHKVGQDLGDRRGVVVGDDGGVDGHSKVEKGNKCGLGIKLNAALFGQGTPTSDISFYIVAKCL